jgi:hypothetical protein
VSFTVASAAPRTRGERLLHHNFVVALLNDLFGIQSRGGCSCAGPYGHTLLGIGDEQSHAFARLILAGVEGIKPGWVRLNLNYFLADAVAGYLVEAVELIARDGWRLLPDYRFDLSTGLWRHHRSARWRLLRLNDVGYDEAGRMTFPHRTGRRRLDESALRDHLAEASHIMSSAASPEEACATTASVSEEFDALLWFELPAVCLREPRATVGMWPTPRSSSPASASSSPTTRSWAGAPSAS